MPWSPGVPEDRQRIFKKYYAVCQLFATAALLGQGLQTLDGAFAIMWPIQVLLSSPTIFVCSREE
jgi:hypothetical protein